MPEAAFSQLSWDFGTARQGTLLKRDFLLANVGFQDLLTYLGTATGISVEGPLSAPVAPADMGVYRMTINTEHLPTGPFSQTIPTRSQ